MITDANPHSYQNGIGNGRKVVQLVREYDARTILRAKI